MAPQKFTVKNAFGEALDCILEGNLDAPVLIFVHGFGTDKDEGFSSFIDLSNDLGKDFMIIRFDQSGYGSSQGAEEEFQFQKAAGDLSAVIEYTKKQFPGKEVNIIAHSLGAFVTIMLSPIDIKNTIFTSLPNANSLYVSDYLKERIITKGGMVDKTGITIYPRSRGGVQKIGKDFWKTLENFNVIEKITELAKITKLSAFKPRQEDVLPAKYYEEYKTVPNLTYIEIPGNHNFSNSDDRKNLITKIRSMLLCDS